jgi:hypothetical protein
MNRGVTELAELRLHQSTAWRDLHIECFREIFAPGAGVLLREAVVAYQAWCDGRQVWASSEELLRQLAGAGYRVLDDAILGVQLSLASAARPRVLRTDRMNIGQASRFLGIESGLLRSLREFGGGPPFGAGPKGIVYEKAGLERWREQLLSEQQARRAADTPERELLECLEKLCRFHAIERRHLWKVADDEYRKAGIAPGFYEPGPEEMRVLEDDLCFAVRDYYVNRGAAPPHALRQALHDLLTPPPLKCKLVRAAINGKRRPQWRGVRLLADEHPGAASYADFWRARSGLHITLLELFGRVTKGI